VPGHAEITSDVLELAWMAGLFDGEGSICITCYHNTKATRSPKYDLVAQIGMTHKATLMRFALRFGGNVGNMTCGTIEKPGFYWKQTEWKALAFLSALEPYLFIKKDQVAIARRLMQTKGHYGGRVGVSPRAIQERHACYEAMRQLNQSVRWKRHVTATTPRVSLHTATMRYLVESEGYRMGPAGDH